MVFSAQHRLARIGKGRILEQHSKEKHAEDSINDGQMTTEICECPGALPTVGYSHQYSRFFRADPVRTLGSEVSVA